MPLSDKVAERLGLSADATDDDVLAKIDEMSAAPAPPAADEPTPQPVDAATPAMELAAAAAKAGLVLMDPTKVTELQTNAALGAQARAEQIAAAQAKIVDAAIAQGKIAPPRRPHFIALIAADEKGTTELLAGIPPETAVPLTEIGHALEPQASITEDAGYKNWRTQK